MAKKCEKHDEIVKITFLIEINEILDIPNRYSMKVRYAYIQTDNYKLC